MLSAKKKNVMRSFAVGCRKVHMSIKMPYAYTDIWKRLLKNAQTPSPQRPNCCAAEAAAAQDASRQVSPLPKMESTYTGTISLSTMGSRPITSITNSTANSMKNN